MPRPGMHSELIEQLREAANDSKNAMSKGDREFASSLVHSFDRFGRLSEKQESWVPRLLERAHAQTIGSMNPRRVEHTKVAVGEMTGLINLLRKARAAGVKWPKIKLKFPEDEINLTLSADGTFINAVAWDGPQKRWYGGVNKEGTMELSDRFKCEELVPTMKALSENPSAAGKAYGQKTGICCFCGSGLKTTDSVFYGYGPVCAENYGLEWGYAKDRIQTATIEEGMKDLKHLVEGGL